MLPIKQPPNGTPGPGRYMRGPGGSSSDASRWQRCYMVSLTLFASATLATLVTFGLLNFLLSDMTLPPISSQTGLLQQQGAGSVGAAGGLLLDSSSTAAAPPVLDGTAAGSNSSSSGAAPRRTAWEHPFDDLQHMYTIPPRDPTARCAQSQICDGDHSCGPDGRGCITAAKERQDHVRKAIAWAWEGYRKYAWGHDEVDVLSKSPHAWFNLGLTIVDSLDTLLIAGLMDEYQEARHWVANHLAFHDGSTVQFFEVNIRILGGLVSAYYLSDGDDLYLHKAEQLADRLMVAFNTSSGMPVTHVALRDAAGRAGTGNSDAQTNIAEAGTISMEFTSIGRLLGRDDMFDAGMQFWYVLMSSRNFSGLYCMGIHTGRADCYNPQMTIGSAADSTYEYMLKQWVLSNHTQQVPRKLYEDSMRGVRQYLVRHVWDGDADMSIVTEAHADVNTGAIFETNNRFEHLTCFAGGMFVLGALHGLSTEAAPDDFHDAVLGARIGRACYELYHTTASGLAPDSVSYKLANGQPLGPRSSDALRPPGILRQPPRHRKKAAKQPDAAAPAGDDDAQQPALDQLPHDVAHEPAQAASSADTKQPGGSDGTQAPAAAVTAAGGDAAQPRQAPADVQAARRLHDEQEQPHYHQQQQHHLHEPHRHEHGQHAHHHQQFAHGQLVMPRAELQHAGRQLLQSDEEQDRDRAHRRLEARAHNDDDEGGRPDPHAQHPHRLRHDEQRDEDAADEARYARRRARHLRAEGRGDPPGQSDEAASALADRRAAEAAQHERLAAAQRERAEQDAAEHMRHEEAAAAHRRHAEEREHAAAQQRAAAAHQQAAHHAQEQEPRMPQAQAAQLLQREAAREGAADAPARAAPQAQPRPANPPPPPAGPQKAQWTQMTAADFLRPETIETLFYLWRATGDEIYREWGWNMFRAFERWTRLETGGYATINNVNAVPPGLANKMESFWVAETLKYFYLLFEDDPNVLPLDEWVFNTEAHPLPIWGTAPDNQAMERLRQRRLAAKLREAQRSREDEAVAELQDIKRQGAALAQNAPQKGKPKEREGYGLGGVDMF